MNYELFEKVLVGESIGEVVCGDCLDIMPQIPDGVFDLIVADPPFNKGKNYGKDFNDNIPINEYYNWSRKWIRECARTLKSTGSLYIYINSQHLGQLQVIGCEYLTWRNTIVWHYTNPTPSQKSYPKTWSAFLFFTKGEDYYFDKEKVKVLSFHTNFEASKHKKLVRLYDCWYDVSKLVGGFLAQKEVILIPGTKQRVFKYQLPQELLRRIILTSSRQNDFVLDIFMHSGVCSRMCKVLGRRFFGVEQNKYFCEVVTYSLEKNFEDINDMKVSFDKPVNLRLF